MKYYFLLFILISSCNLFAEITWQKLEMPTEDKVRYMVDDGERYLYCSVEKEGIYRYDFVLSKWDFLSNGWNLNKPIFRQIIIDWTGRIFANNAEEGLKFSTDNGDSWFDVENEDFWMKSVGMIKTNDRTGIVVEHNGDIYLNNDEETDKWILIYSWTGNGGITDFSFDNSGNIIAFEQLYDPAKDYFFSHIIKYDYMSNQWHQIKDTLPISVAVHFEIDHDNNIYVNFGLEDESPQYKLYISENNSESWKEITGNLFTYFDAYFGIFPDCLLPITTDNIFIGNTHTQGTGILHCDNNKFIFNYCHNGIQEISSPSCFYLNKNGILYTHMSGNIYYTSNPVTSISESHKKENMITVYPNPATNSTNFEFYLSKDCDVNLCIYDIFSSKIATVINRNLIQGNQTILWDCKDQNKHGLAKGIYFYVLTFGEKVITGKVII
ncbi:MAG: T9SS type A sorting domain-containing protein [bacterium]